MRRADSYGVTQTKNSGKPGAVHSAHGLQGFQDRDVSRHQLCLGLSPSHTNGNLSYMNLTVARGASVRFNSA
jgi:hypothetical protein